MICPKCNELKQKYGCSLCFGKTQSDMDDDILILCPYSGLDEICIYDCVDGGCKIALQVTKDLEDEQ